MDRKLVEAPAIAPEVSASAGKPNLLSVDQAVDMPLEQMNQLFVDHLNPGQLHFMKLLGFHKVKIESAEGVFYTDQNGRKILDFFGGFGSLSFGHNHPRILAARKKFQDQKRHEIAMAFLSQYAAALAHNLAAIAPQDLDMVFLGSSGSEAMEAALKVAERYQGPKKSKILFAENAFHGKTKGVLSITDSALYQSQFNLVDDVVKVPFGDLEAIRTALESDPEIGIVCLETIQGGAGIIEAPAEFWQGLRKLCDEKGVLWVADEVQSGTGRSGKFFAFEHYGVVPDVTALAKSLGGGKTAMAAMIARKPIYMKAYGKPATALIHGPATFGGIGEACITSIEALNVMYDDDLMENAESVGAYLKAQLQDLQSRYPKLIKDVRGRGFMLGLEFQDFSKTMPTVVRPALAMLDEKLKGSLSGFIGSALLRDHDVLVAFTEYNRNVVRLQPPLITTRENVDQFIAALDKVLSGGVVKIVTDFVKSQRG
ncbi:MAG: aminotransferase class III-fold pyridoxal phosphate-dependent enzyme [Rhizobiaceae bacterium]|nr:aminotransferase class III-fold pyridoxal phosphate-dependent enzyme [Rhizobiaceae bacterium]